MGTVLRKKWTIDALIGSGGMATVYSATHRNGKRVAIKLLRPAFAHNAEVCERFLREGYAANKVGHPGAVGVLDDDETDDGAVFLVMELLDGGSLSARIRERRTLEPPEVLFIADQVLDVLAHAHPQGIIHRDIKPGNIFLLRDGRVKVLDFGLARVREASSEGPMTREGLVLGTAAYMAPEQAQAKHQLVDARSDIFSVGATMYYAMSGRLVREESTAVDQLVSAIRNPAPSLRSVMPEAPEALVKLVDRALAFDPAQRYPDARAMQAAVHDVFARLTGRPLPSTQRMNLHGVAGWARPVNLPREDEELDISVVFEPDTLNDAAIPITPPGATQRLDDPLVVFEADTVPIGGEEDPISLVTESMIESVKRKR